MPSVAKENPGFLVVVHIAGQSTPSGDVTQRLDPKREAILSLCTILYTDSYQIGFPFSRIRVVGKIGAVRYF